jgi:hypothetical protein
MFSDEKQVAVGVGDANSHQMPISRRVRFVNAN